MYSQNNIVFNYVEKCFDTSEERPDDYSLWVT